MKKNDEIDEMLEYKGKHYHSSEVYLNKELEAKKKLDELRGTDRARKVKQKIPNNEQLIKRIEVMREHGLIEPIEHHYGSYCEYEEVWEPIYGMRYRPPKLWVQDGNVSVSHGWYFPHAPQLDNDAEPACYMDEYFDEEGNILLMLNYGPYTLELYSEWEE